jgi:hypothetical protein
MSKAKELVEKYNVDELKDADLSSHINKSLRVGFKIEGPLSNGGTGFIEIVDLFINHTLSEIWIVTRGWVERDGKKKTTSNTYRGISDFNKVLDLFKGGKFKITTK